MRLDIAQIFTARMPYHIPSGYREDAVRTYGGCAHMRGYVRISYGRTGDVRGMCGYRVRLDILQIPCEYRADITGPLPLAVTAVTKLKVGEISSSCEMCCGTIMVVLIVLASACAKEASSGPDGLFLGRSGVIIHDCQIGPQHIPWSLGRDYPRLPD